MVTPECPFCERIIPPEDVNVANDVAYCRKCNEAHPLSDLVDDAEDEAELDAVNLDAPPAGVAYYDDGFDKIIQISHRAIGTAVMLTGMALFWNGIVSVFVVFNTHATLNLLGIETPWLPLEGDSMMGWGMTIFLWLFLTPFIVIGLSLAYGVAISLAGKTMIRIGKEEASIFCGIGFLGFRRRFDPHKIKKVSFVSHTPHNNNMRDFKQIVLERDGKPIKVSGNFDEDRRHYAAAALRHALPAT